MKRALLIAGGTVGGLGAVLAITPPQLSTTSSINISGGAATGSTGTSSSASASSSSSSNSASTAKPVATKKATSKPTATKSATAQATATASAQPSPTHSATASAQPSPTHSATASATAAPAAKNGTFTGPAIFVNYGTVQVKITVTNGKITDAVAVQAPGGRNDRYTNMAVPILKQQTLKAQSANIQGASGASYTSYGWFKSLQGALADAGL